MLYHVDSWQSGSPLFCRSFPLELVDTLVQENVAAVAFKGAPVGARVETFVGNQPRVTAQTPGLETNRGAVDVAVNVAAAPSWLPRALSPDGRHSSGGTSSHAPAALGRGRGRPQ